MLVQTIMNAQENFGGISYAEAFLRLENTDVLQKYLGDLEADEIRFGIYTADIMDIKGELRCRGVHVI